MCRLGGVQRLCPRFSIVLQPLETIGHRFPWHPRPPSCSAKKPSCCVGLSTPESAGGLPYGAGMNDMNIRQPCVDASVSVRAALIGNTVPLVARSPHLATAPSLNGAFDREVLTSAGAADPSISTDEYEQTNGIGSESERMLPGGYLPPAGSLSFHAKQAGATRSLPSNHGALLAWGRGDFLQQGERSAPFARVSFAQTGHQGAPEEVYEKWNFTMKRIEERRRRRR